MKADPSERDRAAARRRPGPRARRARCRSRPSASTPRARCARSSSRSRSSGSASTRPRIARSASAAAATPTRMAERIIEIVAARGKMHNPETDSGGILLGTVDRGRRAARRAAAGSARGSSTLGSLTLTPLRLDAVDRLDPDSPQVEVAGTAYVFDRAAWAPLPDDLPLSDRARALRRLRGRLADARRCRRPGAPSACSAPGTPASWRWPPRATRSDDGTVVAVDVDPAAVERVAELGLCDIGGQRRPARPARRRSRRCAPPARRRPTSRSWSSTRPAASRPRSC